MVSVKYHIDLFAIIVLIVIAMIIIYLIITAIYFYNLMNNRPPTYGESSFLFWTSVVLLFIYIAVTVYALIRIFTYKPVVAEVAAVAPVAAPVAVASPTNTYAHYVNAPAPIAVQQVANPCGCPPDVPVTTLEPVTKMVDVHKTTYQPVTTVTQVPRTTYEPVTRMVDANAPTKQVATIPMSPNIQSPPVYQQPIVRSVEPVMSPVMGTPMEYRTPTPIYQNVPATTNDRLMRQEIMSLSNVIQ